MYDRTRERKKRMKVRERKRKSKGDTIRKNLNDDEKER